MSSEVIENRPTRTLPSGPGCGPDGQLVPLSAQAGDALFPAAALRLTLLV
jgi:hypothetical protein